MAEKKISPKAATAKATKDAPKDRATRVTKMRRLKRMKRLKKT